MVEDYKYKMISKEKLIEENRILSSRLSDYEDRLKVLEHNTRVMKNTLTQIQIKWEEKQVKLI